MKKKQIAVIGLGTFGYSAATELAKKGIQVLAIDNDAKIIDEISQSVTQALIVDVTDEKAVKEAGVADCDAVIIAIGANIETSILATLIIKELGVKNIIVKCSSVWHLKVAAKLGADTVIYPEFEMAKKLVDSMVTPNILEQIALSKDYNLVEILAPRELVGKAIKDSGIRRNYGVNVIAVRRQVPFINDDGQTDIKEEVDMAPSPDYEIMKNDVLVVIGLEKQLEKFKKA
jgi:trk system potassium uptake protein TrkA